MTYQDIVKSNKMYEELTAEELDIVCEYQTAVYAPVLRKLIESNKYSVKELNIYILDLWEDYKISDETEEKLFEISDPHREFNDVYEDWCNFFRSNDDNPLDVDVA